MRFVRRFISFWIDFIIGDAWEVALGLGIALVVIAYIADEWGGRMGLGFALLATVLGMTWLALLRATAAARRSTPAVDHARPGDE